MLCNEKITKTKWCLRQNLHNCKSNCKEISRLESCYKYPYAVSSKIHYARTYGGKATSIIYGFLIHKVIQRMDFEAGCVQDGNKMSILTANKTEQRSSWNNVVNCLHNVKVLLHNLIILLTEILRAPSFPNCIDLFHNGLWNENVYHLCSFSQKPLRGYKTRKSQRL